MHAKWMQNVENADRQYVGAHLFVDHDSITQVIPLNEEAYHAGDGKNGPGNSQTLAVEICENVNYDQAETNAKYLLAALMKTYPGKKIYKHQDWSGKNCPRRILNENRWDSFVSSIIELSKEAGRLDQIRETFHKLIDLIIDYMKGE